METILYFRNSKNIFYVFLFLIIPIIGKAQWQQDVRLTNDTANSYLSMNNARCIASSGDYVYAVWYDERNVIPYIYYKRSTDGGISWGTDTRLTTNTSYEFKPCIIASGSNVYIVWFDYRNGNSEIYYKSSTNYGINWGTDKRLTNNSGSSEDPSITKSGSDIHIAWNDDRDGNREIYYKHSTDGGVNWGTDVRLSNDTTNSYLPCISVSGSIVHVVWEDKRNGNWEIYYRCSSDGGINWGIETRFTSNTTNSYRPSVFAFSSVVSVVWEDRRHGNGEIYYKRSTDEGINWEQDIRLTNDTASSGFSSVVMSGSLVHTIWSDKREGNEKIYYKLSTNSGISWGQDTRLTNDTAISYMPFFSLSGSSVHVLWNENRNGNWEIYYKRNPTGNVGIKMIYSETPSEYKLFQNYPNPFNPSTKIRFSIKKSGFVSLKVYNILGKEVAILVNEKLQTGEYEVPLSINQFTNNQITSGVYFYKIEAGNFHDVKKFVLVK
jgi:hypothetical protein